MARLRLHRCVLLLDKCSVSLRDRVNEASPYIRYKGRLEVTATQAKSACADWITKGDTRPEPGVQTPG